MDNRIHLERTLGMTVDYFEWFCLFLLCVMAFINDEAIASIIGYDMLYIAVG